jgi:hypothetical protein
MKLKEWKFDKYRTKKDLEMVVAKVVTCAREEGRDTTFDNGRLIPLPKIENFKKRESARDSGATSPNAGKYHFDLKLLVILELNNDSVLQKHYHISTISPQVPKMIFR